MTDYLIALFLAITVVAMGAGLIVFVASIWDYFFRG